MTIEGNGGATTSFSYYLCVVPRAKTGRPDAAVASLYGAFPSKSAYGIDLKWDSTNKLTGEYLSAQDSKVAIGTSRGRRRAILGR